MSANSSSANDSTSTPCDLVFNNYIFFAFSVTRGVLLIPLSILILYLGFHQWRQQQQRSLQSCSHFDVFTYQQAVMELIWGLGSVIQTLGGFFSIPSMVTVGYLFSSIVYFGETSFHILTCLERYLAVVHPVTYRGLQNSNGVKIRNGGIAFTWVESWIWGWVIIAHQYTVPTVPFLLFLVLSFTIILFCSFSVLCALIRRGPGDGHRDKGPPDQVKQRAFFTVMAILGVVFVWFMVFLVTYGMKEHNDLSQSDRCMIDLYVIWFSLPSSFVLPLLYLHKNRKKTC